MKITLRHASFGIEMTVEAYNGGRLIEDITNLDKEVSLELIENLKEVVNELEQHNKELPKTK